MEESQTGNEESQAISRVKQSNVNVYIEENEAGIIETQKAVVDGLWELDGKLFVAETLESALSLYESLFHCIPVSACASTRNIDRGEKVGFLSTQPVFTIYPE